MPDEARKWLEEIYELSLGGAVFDNDDMNTAQLHLLRLLAENERVWTEVRQRNKECNSWYERCKEAEADRDALVAWAAMFTLEDLEGMFNHYMAMQKQAWDNQSDKFTRDFWYGQAKKQREIIEAWQALSDELREAIDV